MSDRDNYHDYSGLDLEALGAPMSSRVRSFVAASQLYGLTLIAMTAIAVLDAPFGSLFIAILIAWFLVPSIFSLLLGGGVYLVVLERMARNGTCTRGTAIAASPVITLVWVAATAVWVGGAPIFALAGGSLLSPLV